jgi:hypothetical protein
MPNENSLSNQILKILEDYIPFVTSDGNRDQIINYAILLAGVAWVYCGIKIYFDIGKRYKLNPILQLLALVFGVVTGPFGLLIYLLMRPSFTQEEVDFIKIEHKFYYQQASKVLECIKCNSYVLEDQIYCTECGTQNRYECENCHTFTDYNDKFCFSCGNDFKNRHNELLRKVGKIQPSEQRSVTRSINNAPVEPKESQLAVYMRHLKRGLVKIFDFGGNIKQTFATKADTLESSPLTLSEQKTLKNDYVDVQPSEGSETAIKSQKSRNTSKKHKKRKK